VPRANHQRIVLGNQRFGSNRQLNGNSAEKIVSETERIANWRIGRGLHKKAGTKPAFSRF
jgi:hypothetical protein